MSGSAAVAESIAVRAKLIDCEITSSAVAESTMVRTNVLTVVMGSSAITESTMVLPKDDTKTMS
jgi:hypothetical protein